MVVRNPFKPTAGATPPLLVGRAETVELFSEGLDDGPGAPGRLTVVTGSRGVGKTVLLGEYGDLALRGGWVVIHETATEGLVDRLTAILTDHLERLGSAPSRRRSITALTAGPVGIGLSDKPVQQVTLRAQSGALLDVLEAGGTGLLITVDEVHRAAIGDLRTLATVFQHLVREGRDVAMALAGLPSAVSDLLNDDVLTFLRRADPVELVDVPLAEVRDALRETVEQNGRTIDDDALESAAEATGGYPFMIQLVGYHVWRKADGDHIDAAAVAAGVPAARKRLGSTVHASALADLSDVDRSFLLMMARDDGPSEVSALAERLGENANYIGVYRRRLIAARVIEPVARGRVDFAIPYLREYLREHAANLPH